MKFGDALLEVCNGRIQVAQFIEYHYLLKIMLGHHRILQGKIQHHYIDAVLGHGRYRLSGLLHQ